MNVGVFIGRFQPIHEGHISALKRAASRCEKLIILVGSADACRSIKNPWTYQERKDMIRKKLQGLHVEIFPVNDYPYSDSQWISDVRETVGTISSHVTLFGHYKDGNDYLRWFPDWKFQDLEATVHLNATQVRTKMFNENDPQLPRSVRDDFFFYVKEQELFQNYPFPETLNFNCADAVVECQGFVLLVQRAAAPGAGTWALPGGFRNRNDPSLLDCAVRELFEETSLKVPEKVIRGSVVATKLYDSNKRSFGIPHNTLAVHIRISPDHDGKLPKVHAADDAADCKWFPLNEVLNDMALYDDHKHIISQLTGVRPIPAYMTK